MDVCRIEREDHFEYWLTVAPSAEWSHPFDIERAFGSLASQLKQAGIQVISEKIYGRMKSRSHVLAVREHVYSQAGVNPDFRPTYLEGKPLFGIPFAGVQIWGLAPKDGHTQLVTTQPGLFGPRTWEVSGSRFAFLPGVCGTPSTPRTQQGYDMYWHTVQCLADVGMDISNVARTWIYMADLLEWYGDFNSVRDVAFQQHGLVTGTDPSIFPASTGIQGRAGYEACLMDVLAVDSSESDGTLAVRPILETERQREAARYGSAFSRGMTLQADGINTIHVSGTASIDRSGQTLHVGDVDAQAEETLRCLSAVLETEGAGLNDICSATVFVATDDGYRAFDRARRRLDIKRFPYIVVQADVCRPDLLIEIEAVAVRPARKVGSRLESPSVFSSVGSTKANRQDSRPMRYSGRHASSMV